MSYIGTPPNQQLRKITSQSFNGDGSTTVFTLNRSVDNGESLEVFVDNVQQEPGTTKSYTAAGTSLTFSEAPQTGTGNVYVIYRGVAEVTTRLEHDPNQALQATTGTFSGALSATTGTFTGNVDINGNDLILDADADSKLYASTDDVVKMNIAGSEVFRFDADGLKFNGDTAAANGLSDYEEGTFSPTPTKNANMTGTLVASGGLYTKIGNLVHIEISFTGGSVTSTGTETSFYFDLPFGAKVNSSVHALSVFWSVSRSNGWAVTRTSSNNDELFVALTPELNTTSGATTVYVSGTYIAA